MAGELAKLQTPLYAELLTLRSDATLQDALWHARADVATFIMVRQEESGGIEGVRQLLAVTDEHGRTALEVALLKNELDAARLLLSKGAPVDAMAGGGDEPLLHMAIRAVTTSPSGNGNVTDGMDAQDGAAVKNQGSQVPVCPRHPVPSPH